MALSHRGICSGEKVRAMCAKRNLYGFCTFVINTKLYISTLHVRTLRVRIIDTCTIYISKSVFTLIDTRTRSISLSPSFIREPACGRLYQFVDACARTDGVCVNAGRVYTHASENTYTISCGCARIRSLL